jgi:beta-lactamase regulating signal transducer with metallopeptidase domain
MITKKFLPRKSSASKPSSNRPNNANPIKTMNPILLTAGELVIKSSSVLLLAFGTQRLWRRAAATQRCLLWLVAFAVVTLLPLTIIFPAAWTIGWNAPTVMQPPTMTVPAPVEPTESTVAAVSEVHAAAGSWVLTNWLGGVWLLGVLLVLGKRFLAARQLQRWKSVSPLMSNPRVLQRMQEIAHELGIQRTVELRESAAASVPCTWGVTRPVLLLPSAAADWDDETLSAALRHELGHVRHGDFLTRLLVTLVSALHWPHPLVWMAGKAWRTAQEQACDDLVVQSGVSPQSYAQQLLAAAQAVQTGGLWRTAALSMAQPSTLETRITAVLDQGRNRQPLRRRSLISGLSVALLVAFLSGLIQWQVQAQDKPNDAVTTLASKLVLSKLVFSNATMEEAVNFLRAKSIELDPAKKGLNFVLRNPTKVKISLTMSEVSIGMAVDLIGQMAGMEVTTIPATLTYVIQPKGTKPTPTPALGPQPKVLELVLKRITFDKATVTEAAAFLHAKSKELDPAKKGINIVVIGVNPKKEPRLTLDLRDIPLSVALQQIAELSGLELKGNENGMTLSPPAKK